MVSWGKYPAQGSGPLKDLYSKKSEKKSLPSPKGSVSSLPWAIWGLAYSPCSWLTCACVWANECSGSRSQHSKPTEERERSFLTKNKDNQVPITRILKIGQLRWGKNDKVRSPSSALETFTVLRFYPTH